MADEKIVDTKDLEIPNKWYFYNLKQSIDDPHKAFSAAALESISGAIDDPQVDSQSNVDSNKEMLQGLAAPFCDPTTPLYSQSTLRKTISPIIEWIPFNPGDNKRLLAAKSDDSPVAVGYERLLFQVHNLSFLRPIYWSIPYATQVTGVRWVFADTLTPIDPHWDEEIYPHFMNFVNNVDTYREALEKSISEPAVMRVIAQRVELRQAGKLLEVDLLFSPANNRVYVFKANSSYICTKQTAITLLAGTIVRGVLAVLKPFSFDEYKKQSGLPDRPSDDPSHVPLPVNNLILVFHGVGQKLSSSYTRINFVYAIDKLRVEIQQAGENPEVYKHFPNGDKNSVRSLVLPVNWRSVFNTDETFNVNAITVPSIQAIRHAFSDALLDIPLYMSENRRPQMLAAAASEANRLYTLVKKNHPTFEQNGRIHLVGHSLGALITADLLTHQPTHLDESTIKDAPLKFQTHNYFTTGSMLGVFMVLKGQHLYPREEFDAECQRNNQIEIKPEDRPFGCFAVRNLYNIIHQSDLLSFLLNPTVKGAQDPTVGYLRGSNGLSLEADELPSSSLGRSRSSSSSNVSPPSSPSKSPKTSHSSSKTSLSWFFSAPFSKTIHEDNDIKDQAGSKKTEISDSADKLLKRLRKLNENGQLDWKIPQPASYIPSHYLKMFTAHFDYWSNKDIANFLAIECGRKPGIENTLVDHRVKWNYNECGGQEYKAA